MNLGAPFAAFCEWGFCLFFLASASMVARLRQLLAAILTITLAIPLSAIASDPSGMNGAVTYTYDTFARSSIFIMRHYRFGQTEYQVWIDPVMLCAQSNSFHVFHTRFVTIRSEVRQ